MIQVAPEQTSVPTPNFDCGKAETRSEKLVCVSYDVSLLDAEFGGLYQRALIVADRAAAKKVAIDEYKETEACEGTLNCIVTSKERAITALAVNLRKEDDGVVTSIERYKEAEEAKRKAEADRLAEVAARAKLAAKAEETRLAPEAERRAADAVKKA